MCVADSLSYMFNSLFVGMMIRICESKVRRFYLHRPATPHSYTQYKHLNTAEAEGIFKDQSDVT